MEAIIEHSVGVLGLGVMKKIVENKKRRVTSVITKMQVYEKEVNEVDRVGSF